MCLPRAFESISELNMENASLLEEIEELSNMKTKQAKEKKAKKAVIRCDRDWDRLDIVVKSITICDNCCNEVDLDELDLSEFANLRYLEIGDECFMHVDEVILIGLERLESVVIGKNSFTMWTCDSYDNPNRHFYLKDCPKLSALIIGCYSFSDYTVCEIENVDALEVIEMGDLNEESNTFDYASLELKSILIHSE